MIENFEFFEILEQGVPDMGNLHLDKNPSQNGELTESSSRKRVPPSLPVDRA